MKIYPTLSNRLSNYRTEVQFFVITIMFIQLEYPNFIVKAVRLLQAKYRGSFSSNEMNSKRPHIKFRKKKLPNKCRTNSAKIKRSLN